MENQENIKIYETSTDVIYQQDKAAIDIQISTAKAYPRNIKRAIENAIAIVTLDKETAETCTYAVPRGGKTISGPSVHLAKILAQNWGNLRIESKVVDVDAKHITSQAVAFDLENNLAIKVEVKRSIMTNKGRMNDDMITVTGNAGNSIALRNAVLSVIPRAIVDKVYNEAKHKITGDVSNETKLIARRKQVFDGLKNTYSLTEAEILAVIGKASIDHVISDDLVVLIGIGQAIKDGDTTVDQAFRKAKTVLKPEQPKPRESYNSESEIDEDLLKGVITKEQAQELKFNFAVQNEK
jgi:antitoxin component of MazEF toxin-antitoxin module